MSDTITVLSDLEKIRQRPGMYIGDNDRLGMDTITREIIDNAIDEWPNAPDKTKPIEITLSEGNVISVRDYGRGISPYPSKKMKGQIEERLAYTLIGSGGKFREDREKTGNRFAGGLNGTGSCGTNAMSEFFDVEIWKDGYYFHDHYEDGIPKTELKNGNLPKKKLKQPETGTKVTFKASKKYMRTTKADPVFISSLLQQKAYLHPGLHLVFRNDRDEEEPRTFHSERGLLDYMDAIAKDENGSRVSFLVEPFLIHGTAEADVMGRTNQMEANIAVAFTRGESFAAETFTNGIENPSGGTHLQGFYQGLVDLLRHYYEEFQNEFQQKYRKQLELIQKVNRLSSLSEIFQLVKPRSISKKTYVILDFKHDDPILKPQTKDTLASPEAKPAVAQIFYEKASLYLDRNISAVHELIGFLIKDLYEKAKNENDTISLSRNEIKQVISMKLAAAKSKDPKKKEIYIVEGDSAGGSIKANRNALYQAVLALRGKILNAKKAILAKLLANAEIATMIAAFGTGIGSKYDGSKLQYDKIIIATDQDVDGMHIQVLLLTFFMEYMPDLVRDGHVYILETPLYVNVMKGKLPDYYTYSEEEQAEFLKKNRSKVEDVQRNKGLGELTQEQVVDTILTPSTRKLKQITIEDEEAVYDLMEQLMGKDVQARRRLFVKEESHNVAKKKHAEESITEHIHEADFYQLYKDNFWQYGMAVIKDRALADVRDGLKPVQRAIVFDMLQSKATSDRKPVKVKRIVGNVIGKWHPHGDSAAEGALVGLAQPWSNTLPAIWIKGNGGSVFGDSAADGRYIEARLTPAGDAYGYKLKEGIVPYEPNFDETERMPTVLPAQLPYLLINGVSEGIAVGVAANLPPHNAQEVLKMTIQYLKHPKTKTEDLLKIMPGPDFPSGATIINKDDLLGIYETGQGKIMVRATIEYDKKEHALHVREIPFSFAGSMDNLVTELVNATTERMVGKKKEPPKITGINAVSNYSGKDGIDICLELAKGIDPEEMKKLLYAKTRLETSVAFNFNALNDKQLHQYSLRRYLAEYTEFQHEIVTNEFLLEQSDLRAKLEIIMGHIIAAGFLDEIIDAVRHSNGRAQVKDVLMHGTILPGTNRKYHKTVRSFQFTEAQADAIADKPLHRLNQLDKERLIEEGKTIQERLKIVDRMVEDRAYRHKEIIRRLEKEQKKLPDSPRKTQIISDSVSRTASIEVPTVPLYVSMDQYGYVRIEGKPFEGASETDNKSRVGFFDEAGNCWNLFLDRTKETKDRGTLFNQLLDGPKSVAGFTTGISAEEGKEGLFLFVNGAIRRVDLSRYMTKTRATRIKTRTEHCPLKAFLDIPEDVNIVTIDGTDYALEDIPLTGLAGTGNPLLAPKEEPYAVSFKQGTITSHKKAAGKKPDGFDAVVTFTEDGKLLFDWETLETEGHEGLYVTTYQELLKETLLFVHCDGTAKRVKGEQFTVKTKRTSIVANKEGVQALDIRPATEETIIGQYTEGKQKRVKVSDISIQGKTGGGIRVFYTPKYQLESVASGEGSDLPVVSFATLPK